jgi:hypothetical protein
MLSVPSSSGNTLQPGKALSAGTGLSAFQSPLHRGILFNEPFKIEETVSSTTFSPLFIGEYSSTSGSGARNFARYFLSVPSSSGNTLQP